MDAGEHQNLLQWGMQKPQQDHKTHSGATRTHWCGDTGQSLEQAEGLPHGRVVLPPHPVQLAGVVC